MHDVKDICARPDFYKEKLATRMENADEVIDFIVAQEGERIRIAKEVEQLRAEINKVSQEISIAMRSRLDCTELLEYAATLKMLMPIAELGELGKWIEDVKKENPNQP